MRLEARRYEATARPTSEAFIETTMSSKPSFSRMRMGMSAASTIPSGSCTPYLAMISLGSDPAFAPTRMGMPRSFAAATISRTRDSPPMLPGLIRTLCTPAAIALRPSFHVKWMSATTGSGEPLTMSGSASADFSSGTATRTISQPASARRRICASVASTSHVMVMVIDCTATGAPPPIRTLPTRTGRVRSRAAVRTPSLPAGPSPGVRMSIESPNVLWPAGPSIASPSRAGSMAFCLRGRADGRGDGIAPARGLDRETGGELSRGPAERQRLRRIRRADDDRHAAVPTLAHRGVERDLAEERDAPALRLGARAAVGEDLVPRVAARADEVRHVLDQAEHRHVELVEHGDRLDRVVERHLLRRADDDRARERHLLDQRELHVARAGRQVDHQVVELAPGDVAGEVLDDAVEHRPAPDHRRPGLDEEAHGHELDAVGEQGQDLAVLLVRRLAHAHHERHVRAVDVGVDQPDTRAVGGQPAGQVDGDRRLADAA